MKNQEYLGNLGYTSIISRQNTLEKRIGNHLMMTGFELLTNMFHLARTGHHPSHENLKPSPRELKLDVARW